MEYLSDTVPVDDNSFGVKSILQLEMDCVAGCGADGRARELVVDCHHEFLFAVRRHVYITHLPFVVPDLGLTGGVRKK